MHFFIFWILVNTDTSLYSAPNLNIYILGFPNGKFILPWKPTNYIGKTKSRYNPNQLFLDMLLYFNVKTETGTSGSPVYCMGNDNIIRLIAVNTIHPNFDINNPTINGAGIFFVYAFRAMNNSLIEKVKSVMGQEYLATK